MRTSRRQFVGTLSGACGLILSGCVGDSGNGEVPTANDLLPEPQQYDLNETHPQAAGMVGANNGMQGVYLSENDEEIVVEILVYENAENAENNISVYTESDTWDFVVLHDAVIYAVDGLTGDSAVEFLSTSSNLDRDTIEQNIV